MFIAFIAQFTFKPFKPHFSKSNTHTHACMYTGTHASHTNTNIEVHEMQLYMFIHTNVPTHRCNHTTHQGSLPLLKTYTNNMYCMECNNVKLTYNKITNA